MRFSVNICEDIWAESIGQRAERVFKKADFLVNISASPYHIDKTKEREKVIGSKAKRFKQPAADSEFPKKRKPLGFRL